jgi:cobalt-zinc-cadmium efflux system outer membrane protein
MKINMTKYISLILIFIALLSVRLFAATPDSTVQLDHLIQEGLYNNPALKASYNAWQAATSRVPQAGSLPDPRLGFSVMNLPINSFAFNQEPMTGKQVSLMQMFPFPGKLGLKQKIANEEAKIFEYQYQELRNELIKNIKLIYYDLCYVDRAIVTSEKNATLLKQFSQIAETRYRVGKGLQQDVLRSEVEVSMMDEKLLRLEQQKQSLWIQLNALLNRPSNATEQNIEVLSHPGSVLKLEIAKLDSLANQNNPLLLAWYGMVQQSEQKLRLAKKDYLPDFNLGVEYTQRDALMPNMEGVDFLSGSVSISLPIFFWKKQNKQVEEYKLNEVSVSNSYENFCRQLQGELENKLNEFDRNIQLLTLYQQGILIQASQSVQSALAAYQVDKVDFLTLVNNQMSLFNYELDYYRILSDYYKNIAELEALVGTKLD